MREQNGSEGICVTELEPLELTDRMIKRNDDIDNAVYACILALAEKNDKELPWSMEIIGAVTDAIQEELLRFDIYVRHPAVVTEPDGTQYYQEYYRFEESEQPPKMGFYDDMYRVDNGIDTPVEPWFDADEKLPFPIPPDADSSDVLFYALYNPDDDSMKYICHIDEYDGNQERIHEFELTENEIALLKEGMEALCQRVNQCSLKEFWENVNYIIEFDRKGSADAVFYGCGNEDFTMFICGFGFEESDGSFSDISVLAPKLGIAAVNLSSGYYNAHTIGESIDLSVVRSIIKKTRKILDTPTRFFEYVERLQRFSPMFRNDYYHYLRSGQIRRGLIDFDADIEDSGEQDYRQEPKTASSGREQSHRKRGTSKHLIE